MKKILLGTLTLLVISCASEPVNYTLLSGKIENPNSNTLSIINSSNEKVREIAVSDSGVFNDTIFDANGLYRFYDQKEQATIYLQNGFDLNLTLNTAEFDESISYTGKGSAENNYLVQKFLKNEKNGGVSNLYALDEAEYLKQTQALKESQDSLLQAAKIGDKFKELEQAVIKYSYIFNVMRYEVAHRYFTKNKDFKVSDSYPNVLENLDMNNEELFKTIPNYKAVVGFNLSSKASANAKRDSISYGLAFINEVSSVNNQFIKNSLIKSLAFEVSPMNPDAEKLYQELMKVSSDEKFKETITNSYNTLQKLKKGNNSPMFENYENYTGGATSLSDLKGKYTYIDVWATWCGPCKVEIPYLKQIEEDYKDKNIQFVSISIDKLKDRDLWKNMIKEKELGGIQLLADKDWQSSFLKSYDIKSIPRFILLDPEGKIVSAAAPRPSDKKLINLLNGLNI